MKKAAALITTLAILAGTGPCRADDDSGEYHGRSRRPDISPPNQLTAPYETQYTRGRHKPPDFIFTAPTPPPAEPPPAFEYGAVSAPQPRPAPVWDFSRLGEQRNADLGPRHAPVMTDFRDEFAAIVTDYVRAQSKTAQGTFLIKDDRTGRVRALRFVRVKDEKIDYLSSTEVVGCLEFESAEGPKERLDLDFTLTKPEFSDWRVSKIMIHRVNGRPRYYYNSENQLVTLDEAAPPAPEIPKPKAPARLSAAVSFFEPSGSGRLQADETASLIVSVANAGPGPAYAVRLIPVVEPPIPGLTLPREVALGTVAANASAKAEVPLAALEALTSGQAKLTLEIKEGNGFDGEPILVQFETRALEPPRLEIAGVWLGGSGAVRAGETTAVSLSIKNSGTGAAQNVVATLNLGSQDLFMSGEPSVALGTISPGQSKAADFEFFVNKRIPGGQTLPVSLTVSEARKSFGLNQVPLNLALGKAPSAPQVVTLEGGQEPSGEPKPAVEDVDSPPRTKAQTDPDSYAVVIGIERYRDVPGVDYAARDAQAVHSYLTRAMGFGDKNVILLQNEHAALADIATYLGPWLSDHVTAKSRVFIFYAGHGAPNPKTGESFLISYDGNPNYTDTQAYPLSQLYSSLAKLPAKEITVALDSCFSGAGGRSLIASGARPLVHMQAPSSVGANTVVLTASSSEQISTYYPDGQHGLFTYFLLKGLRGAAAEKGGRVTTADLYKYLKPNVEREARFQHVEQTPAINPPLAALGGRAKRVWLETK